MLLRVLITDYQYPNNVVSGNQGNNYITGTGTNFSNRLVGKRIYIKDYGYVVVQAVPDSTTLTLVETLNSSFSNKTWFEDLSEALISVSDITKKIETDDPFFNKGVITFDEVDLKIYLDNDLVSNSDSVETAKTYFTTNLTSAKKYYVIINVVRKNSGLEEEKAIFYGFVDFSSLEFSALKDSNNLLRRTASFKIFDKIGSISLLNIEGKQRGNWKNLLDRYLGQHGNPSSLGDNQYSHIKLTDLTDANGNLGGFQFNPFNNSRDHQLVAIPAYYYSHDQFNNNLIPVHLQSGSTILEEKSGSLTKPDLSTEVTVNINNHGYTVGDILYIDMNNGMAGNFLVIEVINSNQFKTTYFQAAGSLSLACTARKIEQSERKILPGETITAHFTYYDFGNDKPGETEYEQFTFYVVDSYILNLHIDLSNSKPVTAVKVMPLVSSLMETSLSTPTYIGNGVKGGGGDIKFFDIKYLERKYYNSVSNYIDVFVNNNYRYRNEIKYIDALKIIEKILSFVYPDITIVNRLYDNNGNIMTEFLLPSGVANLLIDEKPLGVEPLEALKKLADLINCYIYINKEGNLVLQNKKSFDYIQQNTNVIPDNYLSEIKEKYFWDKIYDAVSVYVKSYLPSLTTSGSWDGRYLDGAGYSSLFPNIKARNELSIELTLSERDLIEAGYTIAPNTGFIEDVDQFEALNTIADNLATEYLNFYGKRHSSFELSSVKFDWYFADWDLGDKFIFNSIECFVTNFKFSPAESKFSAEFVEIQSHDYYEKSVLISKSILSSTSTSSSSSSGGSGGSYIIKKDNLFWSGVADYLNESLGRQSLGLIIINESTSDQTLLTKIGTSEVALVNQNRTISVNAPLTGGGNLSADIILDLSYNTTNLKLTSNQLNTIQDISTTSTPVFNQITLNNAGTITTNAVRADRLISTSYPLTGGGNLTANRTLSLSYNTTNLKLTSNQLNTIQNIHITATPQFFKLGLGINAGSKLLTLYDDGSTRGEVTTSNFVSGWAGSGWSIIYNNYDGYSAEFDSLTVRGTMRVYELIINQIRATNGSLFVSSAAKISDIQPGTIGDVKLIFEDPEGHNLTPFLINDILLIQRVNLNNSVVIKRIFLSVIDVSNNSIEGNYLITPVGNLEIGDTVVRIGNTINTNRMGGIYLTSDDNNAPFIDVFDNISSVSDWNSSTKTKVRLGKLDGIVYAGQNLSGYGLFSENAYLTGQIFSIKGGFGDTISNPAVKISSKGLIVGGSLTTNPSISGLYVYGIDGTDNEVQIAKLGIDGIIRFGSTNKYLQYTTDTGILEIKGDVTISNSLTLGNTTTEGIIKSYGVNSLYNGDGIYISNDYSLNNAKFRIGSVNGLNLVKGILWDSTNWLLKSNDYNIFKSSDSNLWDLSINSLTIGGYLINYAQTNEDFETGNQGDDEPTGWSNPLPYLLQGYLTLHSNNGINTTVYYSGTKSYLNKVTKNSSPYPLIKASADFPYYPLGIISKTLSLSNSGINKTYYLLLAVRVESQPNSLYPVIIQLNVSDGVNKFISNYNISDSPSWEVITLSFSTASANPTLQILWSISTTSNVPLENGESAGIYIDNLIVYESIPFTEWSNNGMLLYSSPYKYIKIGGKDFIIKGVDLDVSNVVVRGDLFVYGNVGITGDIGYIPPGYNPSEWDSAYTHSITTGNPHNTTKSDIGLNNVTNNAQVKKISSSTIGNIPTWSVSTGDELNNGYGVQTVLSSSTSHLVRADAIYTAVESKIAKSIGTAKGDIIVYSDTNNPIKLSVGSNNQILIANSAEIGGIKWASLTSSIISDFNEAVDDRVGTLIINGNATTKVYDDNNNTLKIDVNYNSTNLKLTSGALNTVQDIATTSSPTFATVKLTNLTDGYIPYHINDVSGLANSLIYQGSDYLTIGLTSKRGRFTIVSSDGIGRSVAIDNREVKFFGDGVANFSLFGATSGESYFSIRDTSASGSTGSLGITLLVVNTSGNVGMGTTSPTEKLDVIGNIKASGTLQGTTAKLTNLTDGYVPYHTNKNGLVDSTIFTDGTNIGIGTTTLSYKLDVAGTGRYTGDLKLDTILNQQGTTGENIFKADINQQGNKSLYNNFTSGWTGTGWRLDNGVSTASRSNLELDDLTVRGTMRVYELIINQIRATNGSLFVTSSAKAESVTRITGDPVTYTIIFEDPEGHGVCPFAINDIVLVQRVRLDSITVVKQIALQVTNVSGKQITGSVLFENGQITKGDLVVRIGNTNNIARQGSVYLTSDDSNAPYIDIVDGVNSWSAWGNSNKIKVRLGKLTGITDSFFGALTGYGLYAKSNAYLRGKIYAESGSWVAGWTTTNTEFASPIINSNHQVKLVADNTTGVIGTYLDINTGGADPLYISLGKIKIDDTTYSDYYGLSAKDFSGKDYFELSNNRKHIANWDFTEGKLYKGTDIELNASTKSIGVNNNKVKLYYTSSADWGIIGKNSSNNTIFQLGSTNNIAGWNFDNTYIWKLGSGTPSSSPARGLVLNSTTGSIGVYGSTWQRAVYMHYTNDSDWGIKGYSSDGNLDIVFQLGSTNTIANWSFDSNKLYNSTYIELNAANKSVGVNNNKVKLYYTDTNNWGILGQDASSNTIFQLGSTNNIAGWQFNNTKFSKSIVSLEASTSMKGLVVDTDKVRIGEFTSSNLSNTFQDNTITFLNYSGISASDSAWSLDDVESLVRAENTQNEVVLTKTNNSLYHYAQDTEIPGLRNRDIYQVQYQSFHNLYGAKTKLVGRKTKIEFKLKAIKYTDSTDYNNLYTYVYLLYFNSGWGRIKYYQLFYQLISAGSVSYGTPYIIDKTGANAIEFYTPNIDDAANIYIVFRAGFDEGSGMYAMDFEVTDLKFYNYLGAKTAINQDGFEVYNSDENYIRFRESILEINSSNLKINGRTPMIFLGRFNYAPDTPNVGDVYYNTGNSTLYMCYDYSGSNPLWKAI